MDKGYSNRYIMNPNIKDFEKVMFLFVENSNTENLIYYFFNRMI